MAFDLEMTYRCADCPKEFRTTARPPKGKKFRCETCRRKRHAEQKKKSTKQNARTH